MDQHQKITVYSSGTSDHSIKRHFREIFKELPQAHELGYRLFTRNIKAKYRQSLLGFTWALLPPLITAGLWIFLRGNNVINFGETNIPYPLFVLVGTMLWQIFTESIQGPLKSIITNKAMLVKINVPREGLLLSGIYETLFNTVIKIVLIGLIFIGFKQSVSLSVLWAIPGILSIILCGISIGLVLTPLGALYTDIQQGLTLVLPFLMYLTPVIYPMPEGGAVGIVMKLNPMATLLVDTRNWFTSQPVEDLGMFFGISAAFLILAFISLLVFRISMPMIIERIGN